ncbi:hypothetical protein A0257_06045 [Hymenobacter psoromatis]|nr:hypothetical protein A0257_06045 [Hymenobacter psoromatis]
MGATLVVLSLAGFGVYFAVQLNGQKGLDANKVNDVCPDGVLATKPNVKLRAAERLPQNSFGRGSMLTIVAGVFLQVFTPGFCLSSEDMGSDFTRAKGIGRLLHDANYISKGQMRAACPRLVHLTPRPPLPWRGGATAALAFTHWLFATQKAKSF